ncbi:transcription factor TFIIH complex subunit Tfb5-domain-containing protein [Apodospora peruviana]|uniref:General transcription and DNA repair factor IIH subunit TFB5 n=1 Tax=Apodospora peruviana TaxID=516989 RepID=A0AAE0MAX3_9PEZI|nr:transcription factor TFIIH complex subunit Tfb5-domain-containing protein [Apodospora peruviana]
MPRAIRGNSRSPPKFRHEGSHVEMKFLLGVFIECEPAIKAIILHLDSESRDIVIEDLDEQHMVVKENMVDTVKQKLEDRLKETYRPEEPLDESE